MTVEISKNPLSLSYSVYISKYEKEEEENNDDLKQWLKEHKQTKNNYEYVLAADVDEERIKDFLISQGFEYKKHIKDINNKERRGYKKLI